MEGHKNKITVLAAEINRINEENQKLKSMFKRVSCRYNHLQKHITSMLQHQKEVDGCQIFDRDHPREDMLCPRSINVDSGSSNLAQSDQYWDGREQDGRKEKKKCQLNNGRTAAAFKEREEWDYQFIHWADGGVAEQEDSGAEQGLRPTHADRDQKNRDRAHKIGGRHDKRWLRMAKIWAKDDEKPTNDRDLITNALWRPVAQLKNRFDLVLSQKNPVIDALIDYEMDTNSPTNINPMADFEQVQGCAQDPTIMITTYEGEHTHFLSPLAMPSDMHVSSNQLIGEGMNKKKFVADNENSRPCISRISTSSAFPTITLDLTDNPLNRPGLQSQPTQLTARNLQHFTSCSNDMGQVSDYHNQQDNYSSIIQDSVASLKADPNFTASLAVPIAGSLVSLGTPVHVMPKTPSATQFPVGSTQEPFVYTRYL